MTGNTPIISVVKLGTAFLFLCIELFIHCYLLDIIQTKVIRKTLISSNAQLISNFVQKESVSFGMYGCNWTPEDLKFQKFLLLSMRMNDANKLKIKITETNVINLKFFSDVFI